MVLNPALPTAKKHDGIDAKFRKYLSLFPQVSRTSRIRFPNRNFAHLGSIIIETTAEFLKKIAGYMFGRRILFFERIKFV
jgi:hypothetical protein